MVAFLEKNHLFSNEQFGFRPIGSCAHAIASVTDLMRKVIDSQKWVSFASLTFKKHLTKLIIHFI